METLHLLLSDIAAVILIIVNILVFISRSNKIEHRLTALETSVKHISKQVDKIH